MAFTDLREFLEETFSAAAQYECTAVDKGLRRIASHRRIQHQGHSKDHRTKIKLTPALLAHTKAVRNLKDRLRWKRDSQWRAMRQATAVGRWKTWRARLALDPDRLAVYLAAKRAYNQGRSHAA